MKFSINYTVIDCNYCSFQFAVPNSFIDRRRNNHKGFYCPSCRGSMVYNELNDKERLTRQLSDVQECCTRFEEKSESLYRKNIALRGHLTRKTNQLKVA
jgi:hypothetical protein